MSRIVYATIVLLLWLIFLSESGAVIVASNDVLMLSISIVVAGALAGGGK